MAEENPIGRDSAVVAASRGKSFAAAWVRRVAGIHRVFGAGILIAAMTASAVAAEVREVINAGIGGNNTVDLLARLDEDVLAHEPEVVVLLVGTNDMVNSGKARTVPEYREGLRTLVTRIKASGAGLLLVTVPPVYTPYLLTRHPAEFYAELSPDQRISAANEVVREVAREYGLPVADFHAACVAAGGASEDPESLLGNPANSGRKDGVHPTAAGYRVLANVVAKALHEHGLAGARRIVCFGDSITRGVRMKGAGTATGDTYPAYLARTLNASPGGP